MDTGHFCWFWFTTTGCCCFRLFRIWIFNRLLIPLCSVCFFYYCKERSRHLSLLVMILDSIVLVLPDFAEFKCRKVYFVNVPTVSVFRRFSIALNNSKDSSLYIYQQRIFFVSWTATCWTEVLQVIHFSQMLFPFVVDHWRTIFFSHSDFSSFWVICFFDVYSDSYFSFAVHGGNWITLNWFPGVSYSILTCGSTFSINLLFLRLYCSITFWYTFLPAQLLSNRFIFRFCYRRFYS